MPPNPNSTRLEYIAISFIFLPPPPAASPGSTDPNEPGDPFKKRKLVPLVCAMVPFPQDQMRQQRPSSRPYRARNVDCMYDDDPNITTTANLRRPYHHQAEQ
ncbi:hypothetical protein PGQ11_010976 [Apiospora arundinis]|uniref:Uncharacterized protein n=1 Tax=Apiospora arundinis TaxID=335852 RepID=A0ABR2HY49_9PEZI